ncbi:MAG: DsbA family protein [Pseudomonadota bacterium]
MRTLFVCGLGSRYSYLASTQLPRLEEVSGRRFEWYPVNSIALIRAAHGGRSPFDATTLRGQYDPAYRSRDAARWAEHFGIPYHEPDLGDLTPDDMADACWLFEEAEARRVMCIALFETIFAEGRRVTRDVVAAIAAGLRPSRGEVFAGPMAERARASHEQALAAALRFGAFGVPTFVVDDQLFWGTDRVPLVERFLLEGRTTSRR